MRWFSWILWGGVVVLVIIVINNHKQFIAHLSGSEMGMGRIEPWAFEDSGASAGPA